MTRRKSVCSKWTLVLVLFVCPFVFSRPQESQTTLGYEEKSTESVLRYTFRIDNDTYIGKIDKNNISYSQLDYMSPYFIDGNLPLSNRTKPSYRTNRLIHKSFKTKQTSHDRNNPQNHKINSSSKVKKKPHIKKIITKWTDNVKDDNLEFSREDLGNTKSNVQNSFNNDFFTSTEENSDETENVKASDKRYSISYRPQSVYSEETNVYSSNVQIIDKHPYHTPTRPTFIFNTPTPTPIVTNLGYPQPWPESQRPHRRPVKPIKSQNPYNTNQNNYPQHPGNIFEVTTFPPSNVYTDRIIIRPEEYAGVSDDCPTIFLTLNNTFQGQGKEACPDLNIAVNTNVVNKNNVIESDEETDVDTTLTDIFGLPPENSESEETVNDYADSDEVPEDESAAIESLELSNYNAANSLEAEPESANLGLPNSPISALSRPSQNDDSDDGFGLSSVVDFFRPAIGAFSWLATVNPLSFPVLSFVLAPIFFIVASTSGLAALFAPWALSYAREAPKANIYSQHWEWDEDYKTWSLNSAYKRNWRPDVPFVTRRLGRRSDRPEKLSWIDKIKQNFTLIAQKLLSINRKNRKKK